MFGCLVVCSRFLGRAAVLCAHRGGRGKTRSMSSSAVFCTESPEAASAATERAAA